MQRAKLERICDRTQPVGTTRNEHWVDKRQRQVQLDLHDLNACIYRPTAKPEPRKSIRVPVDQDICIHIKHIWTKANPPSLRLW